MAMSTVQYGLSTGRTYFTDPMMQKQQVGIWDWQAVCSPIKLNEGNDWATFQTAGPGLPQQVGEHGLVPMTQGAELAQTVATVVKYAQGFAISVEMEQDFRRNKSFLKDMAGEIGSGHAEVREQAITTLFVDGFDSTKPLFDGTEWFGTHTTYSGATYTNYSTADVSYDSVWDVYDYAAGTMINEAGRPITDEPAVIVANPIKRRKIDTILQTSEGRPGTANNDKNLLQGKLKAVYNRFLPKGMWFILCGGQRQYVKLIIRKPVTTIWESQASTLGKLCTTYQRFATVVCDPRRAYGFNTGES